MTSYGVVPGEAQFKKEAGLPNWFLTVVCQGWCVRRPLETYKLEIFEANCGLASDARVRFSLYWIEIKLQYMYLDSASDLWPPGHFALGFFASRIGRSEMKFSALGFSYECWKPRNGQLAKMGSFHQRKRSDNKWYAVEVRWGIFIENLTYCFIPQSGRKYSHTNSYNSAVTVIVQDDHLTAGTWAACGYINAFKFEIFSISKKHTIHCSKYS